MARPQKENGFAPLANEILDEICQYKFNASQLQIIIKVWRLTYGYSRKDHDFSISFLQQTTRLATSTVKREVGLLIKANVLQVTKEATNAAARKLSFNKDYEQWAIEKRGDDMSGEHDLFSDFGVSDSIPQDKSEVSDPNPPEVSDLSPQVITLGYQIRAPYKEKDLKEINKEKEQCFNEFYSCYPRKVSKASAIKAWNKLCKMQSFSPDTVIANTQNYAETCKLLKTEARYIPHPSTYLNNSRWEDYPVVDPEGLEKGSKKFSSDMSELQRMMKEAEERERIGSPQALLDNPNRT
ncbi:hypothetical protein PA598K_01449 [Paenibacillus sp. 598K]|uniref:replication protein n=1 Tax=Paenibacillus sp. 598K TaxID=1117987 RepID=UPI000FFA4400|nr:replication protein [Paenibacillus sp. 598K]GBF73164.1 hypothetical protein PA598K_01449 [Paenibacillus sp. 598K]